MSSIKKKKKSKLSPFWLILVGSLVVLAVLIMFQPEREAIDPTHLPWNSHYDQDGKLNVLGLTINESSLNDAMKLYGKDVEIKIFSEKDESNKSIEAYFPVIYIGSVKAAIALKIDLTQEELDQAYSAGKTTTVTPTGGREVELYSSDVAKFMNHKLSSITLLPRKHLTERSILIRFGEPDKKEIQSDNLPHWFFYSKGLELIIDDEGPEALQYSHKVHP